jgi:hypothetical protein
VLLPLLLATTLSAAPSLKVNGLPGAGELQRADLEALAPAAFTGKLDGAEHQLRGAPLGAILKKRGFTPGPMGHEVPKQDKRAGYKLVVLATAADGFQAVFSCAEVAEGMGATRAFVLFEVDGKPIEGEKGPFRLWVQSDVEPSRSIWSVQKLEVVDPRPLAK